MLADGEAEDGRRPVPPSAKPDAPLTDTLKNEPPGTAPVQPPANDIAVENPDLEDSDSEVGLPAVGGDSRTPPNVQVPLAGADVPVLGVPVLGAGSAQGAEPVGRRVEAPAAPPLPDQPPQPEPLARQNGQPETMPIDPALASDGTEPSNSISPVSDHSERASSVSAQNAAAVNASTPPASADTATEPPRQPQTSEPSVGLRTVSPLPGNAEVVQETAAKPLGVPVRTEPPPRQPGQGNGQSINAALPPLALPLEPDAARPVSASVRPDPASATLAPQAPAPIFTRPVERSHVGQAVLAGLAVNVVEPNRTAKPDRTAGRLPELNSIRFEVPTPTPQSTPSPAVQAPVSAFTGDPSVLTLTPGPVPRVTDGGLPADVLEGGRPLPEARDSSRSATVAGPQSVRDVPLSIARAALDGATDLTLRLRPPELGYLTIRIHFANGQIQVDVNADRPETLYLLQREADGFERALRHAGLDLRDGGLQFGSNGDTARHRTGASGAWTGTARDGGGEAAEGDKYTPGDAKTAVAQPQYRPGGGPLGALDIRL